MSNEEIESSVVARSWSKSSDETIHVPAYQGEDFKNCCMISGKFDGSDRDHFFQGVNR
jgi:hypothetical protein